MENLGVARVSDIEHIKAHANIPERYKGARFEAKTAQQQSLVNAFRNNINGGKLSDVKDMLIVGNVGTGKTYITIGALNTLIANGIYCRYVTEYELLDTYFRKDYTRFDGFKVATFLVIDELGKRELQDWQRVQLEELISYRYNEMLPTFFITNMDEKEFKRFVGDRVTDRLRDNGVIRVAMTGESLRGKTQIKDVENA